MSEVAITFVLRNGYYAHQHVFTMKKYELRGYDRYDWEYYRIGLYDTYEEAMKAFKEQQKYNFENHNDDPLDVQQIEIKEEEI